MKLLMSVTMAALLAAAAPVWAHGGHGHGKKQNHGYYHVPPGHLKHHRGYYAERSYYYPRPVKRYYYEYSYAYPAYPAYPAPGVHVVLPNVFIPF